ncbi:MAG: cell division protein ZapA [Gammaproteobacteria bacterium]
MSDTPKPVVSIKILDKEYLVSCQEEERELLYNAAAYLEDQMQQLKNSGKVVGTERIAVTAALNIANELLAHKKQNEDYSSSVDSLVQRLQHKIDGVLLEEQQLQM